MIFGKYINKYYRKYAGWLVLGLAALIMVDYMQLVIPNLYQLLINGMNQGWVLVDGARLPFDMDFLLDRICMPMVWIVLAIVVGRFLWRVCIFGAAIKVETDLPSPRVSPAPHFTEKTSACNWALELNSFLQQKMPFSGHKSRGK